MRRLELAVLLCVGLVMGFAVYALAGDLVDILKEKGVITEDEAKEAKSKEINVLEKIDFKADLRLRHDTQWIDVGTNEYARNRERFRLRLGAEAKTTETTEVGVRLVSGSGFQNTTNQSFDSHFRGKNIFIDLAYASWEPCDYFSIAGGKHKNPLFTTPLVWDPDVNPEGLSEAVNIRITDRAGIFANFGQWFVEELSSTATDTDPTMLAYQLGATIEPSRGLKLQLAGSYYEFLNLDSFSHSDLGDDDTFVGYNDSYGQQMIFDGGRQLVNDFECWEVGAKLSVKQLLPVPFSLFGTYLKNEASDVNELIQKGVNPGDSNPADLAKYGDDDRDTGWLVGVSFGNKKEKGDWYGEYHYQTLEDYAFPAVFVDSDFHGGGTNNKGHYIHGRYFLTDNIHAAATGFITEREDERKDGQRDESRIQLDVVFTF